LLAAKDGTRRGLGLRIVDRVATTWGVRQEGTGGKTVWSALDLPPKEAAMVGRRLPAMIGSLGPELVWSKLRPPAPREGLLPRARLQVRLQVGLQGKLCLLDAPAGFGKTTLLTQWYAGAGAGRVAWVSLDKGDNDPTRFWTYVVEAFRTIEPDVGTIALQALQRPSTDLYRAVLPSLLNELSTIDPQLVLVLDDYHLVTNAACHQTLGFSWTISRQVFMWRCRHGLIRRCPWPGCEPGASWPRSGSWSSSSPTRRRPHCSTARWGWSWPPRTWSAWPSGPRAGRPGCTWPASRFAAGRTPAGSSPPYTATTITWPTT
jgi:hypothetical protein